MLPISRKKFLEYAASSLIVPFCPAFMSCDTVSVSSGVTYIRSIGEILSTIMKKEGNSIRDAANLCADTVIGHKHCFLFTGIPAYPGYLDESTPGLPGVFVNLRSQEMADTLNEGDTVLAMGSGKTLDTVRTLGARIITVSPFTGEGDSDGTAEINIGTHLPYPDGMVKHPDYTFSILSGYGLIRTALVTALSGEIYRRSGGIGLTGKTAPKDASQFLGAVRERIKRLAGHSEAVKAAGKTGCEALRTGGRFFVYDSNGALKSELSGCSGIPLFARSLSREQILDGMLKKGDAVLFVSLSSNDITDLNLIRKIKTAAGDNAIISICPHDETGGYRLFKESSVSLDNLSPEKEGILTFDNGTRQYLHTGGIMNIALLWMLIGEMSDILSSQGEPPCYMMSDVLEGSEQHNAQARSRAEQRGY